MIAPGAPSQRHQGASVWPLEGFAFGLEIRTDGCRLVARNTEAPVEIVGTHLGAIIAVNEDASDLLWVVNFDDLVDYQS